MFMPVFARNPIEHGRFSSLDIAMVGAGSIGGALFDILVHTGAASFSVIDPEDFAAENVGRHVLTASSVAKPKVEELARHAQSINPDCKVRAIKEKFDPALLATPPDLIISTADSFQAASLVNGFALRHKIPAVFGGVWGEASVAEIMYVIPGKTPCYECYAGFRRHVEILKDERRYTDPNYDDTRIPGQAGLWANILMVAGLQFQVVLGLVGLRHTLRFPGNVWLMNISDPFCAFQPLALTVAEVKKGCAVCDKEQLEELRKESLLQAQEMPDMSEFNPGVEAVVDLDLRKREFAEMLEILEQPPN
ncbi:MAG TPA: ThiF family adenylyltransferase [Terriglobales bacterium]|nr:ThiF family adenylyltransferase [Terriglobales bacterium]